MCGICFICCLHGVQTYELNSQPILADARSSGLARRGPDAHDSVECILWPGIPALFEGFVLHLRGETVTSQPVCNADGDVLLWNGEIFDGIQVGQKESDTGVLFQRLSQCAEKGEILQTLQALKGPWALVFWQAKEQRLWFGRDVLGRRSLLWHLPVENNAVFALTSVASQPLVYSELPSLGLFCLERLQPSPDSDNPLNQPALALGLHPWLGLTWPHPDNGSATLITVAEETSQDVAVKLGLQDNSYINFHMKKESLQSWMPALNWQLPDPVHLASVYSYTDDKLAPLDILWDIEKKGEFETVVTELIDTLQQAVMKRVTNLPRPLPWTKLSASCVVDYADHGKAKKLGGSDSHRSVNSDLPGEKPSSIFFAGLSLCECSEGSSESVCVQCSQIGGGICETERCRGQTGGGICETERRRGQTEGGICETERWRGQTEHCREVRPAPPARVAVLFSGGVDSTVIAALADRCVPSEEAIDLINVAFQQKAPPPQLGKKIKRSEQEEMKAECWCCYDVPDRLTARSALPQLNPNRSWNFVEVNVTEEMLQEKRSSHIRHLVFPLQTVLDDSIGCAVWFAARGKGLLANGLHKGRHYSSKAKVILCGMGADEQLGGYLRHRRRFQCESWAGLTAEVQMEIHRISARNLGRDDRIIGDHGKEARFPYLDEDVLAFLASLPMHCKADLRLPQGVGEKLILRLAALRLGLPSAATLPKRAIQFGSRIAKLQPAKEKGSHLCQRLTQS